MDHILPFVEQYGYLLLFGVGFVEFIGLPIASTPFIMVAGALAARGALHPVVGVGSLVAGALLADAVWYALARWRGRRLVERVCGLTSHPRACIFSVTGRVARVGPPYVLVAKLLPGTGHLIAPAAGFAGMRARTFLLLDAAGLALWAGAYLGAGWLFAPWVADAVRWIEGATRGAIVAGVILVGAAGVWRLVKARRHRAAHAVGMPEPAPSNRLPASGAPVSA